jgi:hypothetical protein
MTDIHENLVRVPENLKSPSNRAFGIVFTSFFCIFGFWPLLYGSEIREWAIAIACVMFAITSLRPSLLTFPNKLWLHVGLLMHRIASPITLAIIFYLAVTPTGLIARIFKKDILRLKFEPTAKTYWIARERRGPTPESLNDQF